MNFVVKDFGHIVSMRGPKLEEKIQRLKAKMLFMVQKMG